MKFSKKAFTDKIDGARKASNEQLAVKLEKDLKFYESQDMIASSRPRRTYSEVQLKSVSAIQTFFDNAKEKELKTYVESLVGTTFVDANNKVKEITNVRTYFDTKEVKQETSSETETSEENTSLVETENKSENK